MALRKRFMARADALFPVGRRRRRSSASGAGVPQRAVLIECTGNRGHAVACALAYAVTHSCILPPQEISVPVYAATCAGLSHFWASTHMLGRVQAAQAMCAVSGESSGAERLAAVLALRAFVLSAPYDVPSWLPDVLLALVRAGADPPPVRPWRMLA